MLTASKEPCQSVRGVNNFHDVLIYSCVVNVFSDLAIMAFPLHKLRSLQVRAAQKTILALIFSLVLFVIAVDVARTVISIKGGAVGAQSAAWGVVEATVSPKPFLVPPSLPRQTPRSCPLYVSSFATLNRSAHSLNLGRGDDILPSNLPFALIVEA